MITRTIRITVNIGTTASSEINRLRSLALKDLSLRDIGMYVRGELEDGGITKASIHLTVVNVSSSLKRRGF